MNERTNNPQHTDNCKYVILVCSPKTVQFALHYHLLLSISQNDFEKWRKMKKKSRLQHAHKWRLDDSGKEKKRARIWWLIMACFDKESDWWYLLHECVELLCESAQQVSDMIRLIYYYYDYYWVSVCCVCAFLEFSFDIRFYTLCLALSPYIHACCFHLTSLSSDQLDCTHTR